MGLLTIGQAAANYKTQKTYFTTTTTPAKAIAANPNRVAIIFCDTQTGTFIGTADAQPTTSRALVELGSGQFTMMLTFDRFGPFVQEEFWTVRGAGSSTTGITEIIYTPTG